MYEGAARPRAEIEYRRRRAPRAGPAGQGTAAAPPRPDRLWGGRDGGDRHGRGRHQRQRRLRRPGSGAAAGIRAVARRCASAPGRSTSGIAGRRQDAPLDPEGEVLRRVSGQGLRRAHRPLGAALPATPQSAGGRRRGRKTAKKIVRAMPKERRHLVRAGFFGERTACGKTLRRKTIGVAHRQLPCGTKVTLKYRGRYVRPDGDRSRPVRQRRSLGPDPEDRSKASPHATDTIRAAPIK